MNLWESSSQEVFWAAPKLYKLILQLVKMQMAVPILESSLGSQHPAKASQLQEQVCP